MGQDDRWWLIKERPFRSDVPVLGRVIVWLRTLWNSVATRWYVLPLVAQQNAVNQRLVEELTRIREELEIVQQILVSLDCEQQDSRRVEAGAIYALVDRVQQLDRRLDGLATFQAPEDEAS